MSATSRDHPGGEALASFADAARVVVLTRVGCHLCEDAERAAAAVCGEVGASLAVIDIDGDPDLKADYTDHVPVTFVDGVRLSYWFLDPDALRAALTR